LRVALALAVLLAARTGRADEVALVRGPSVAALSTAIGDNFTGERKQGIGWLVVGVAGLGAGVALLAAPTGDAGRAFGVPALVGGVIEAAMGVWLLARSGARADALRGELHGDAVKVAMGESKRIGGINRSLFLLRITEVVAFAASAATAAGGAAYGNPTAIGLGLGLAVEFAALFVLDTFHAARGARYSADLDRFLGGG
jgi:hypothetical protein